MELSNKSQQPQQPLDPLFRLNIKKNFKGDYGFEYTIKGDTIHEIEMHDYEVRKHLFDKGLISEKPEAPSFLQ
jgi:uncharacterized protein (DUF2249 family)